MYECIANIIFYFHMGVMFFILTGAFLLPDAYLHYYILLIILVFLDWNDRDGLCSLTKLEYYFRYGIWITRKEETYDLDEPIEFFRPLLHTLFGINEEEDKFPIERIHRLNYFIFASMLLIAFIRFLRYCK